MHRMIATLILFTLLALPAFAQQDVEQQKIAYLIESVATLQGATFIRNGTEYDAKRAADHMRLKLRFAGSRVKTAEDFITYCGTGSSMSGIKYTIRFQDGHIIDSATFLHGKLAGYEARMASDTH
ncbi:hypothetical protein EAH75_00965 [Rhodanobacter glycinis]|uniref:DUF3316 domain-containing protein n=2 Tax=Rhodanobacter glycinis TaxID=582702 RepID=A0A502C3Y5_9GAMM|nr:DUF5329 family protein [Rhodanobacter glycinis]TPG08225.1 hypothetical protein EAH88_11310 [Rhodanobacter glycinis]TPG50103.1 hypothetical protein EAH75_00965 [Rhodanobacter glycinis]